jgi:hypothetical protein
MSDPVPATTGWQPVETAPKDGTVIDLWLPDGRAPACRWGRNGWQIEFAEMPGSFESLVAARGDAATHWMPLPEGPKE